MGNSVQKILQDSIGYLWFASQSGLFRYDGQNITAYNQDPNNPNSILSDYIEDIYIDSKGILWMTHWGTGGLTSFDPDLGIFTRYEHDPDDTESLLPGETAAIVEDRDGFIWVGGQQGLNRFNRETGKFKRFQHDPEDPTSLSDNEVRALYVDQKGALWIGMGLPWITDESLRNTGGLNRYIPGSETFTRYLHDPEDSTSIISNKVRAIFEDSKGNFWIGTSGDGLHLMDRDAGTFKRLTYDASTERTPTRPFLEGTGPDELPVYSHITSIYEDNQGRIWITAIVGGINVYNPETGETFHFESGQPEIVNTNFINPENGESIRLESGQLEIINTNFIWQTFQSRDKTIWICTGGEGAQVFKVNLIDFNIPFFEYDLIQQDSAGSPHGILEDRNGHIWYGQSTENQPWKLWQINRKTNAIREVNFGESSYSDQFISTLLGSLSLDLSGNLWVGTGEGYFIANPDIGTFQRFAPKNLPAELTAVGIPPIMQLGSGEIWLPGWDVGLTSYDPKSGEYQNFRHDPDNPASIRGNLIWGMYEDRKGNLWVGGGTPWYDPSKPMFLDRYNSQSRTFDHFLNLQEEIKVGVLNAITEDNLGNIWFINFSGGLFKLNPEDGDIRKYSANNSLLPDMDFTSMIRAKDGHLWITTDKHIVEMDPETESITVYDEYQGVKSVQWGGNSSNITADGELLFARKGGYHAFYPENLYQGINDQVPDLRITGFRLLDEPVISGSSYNEGGVLEQPIWKTKNISLDHNENVFSFTLACFDFYEPEANQMQFMLEGYDRGWRQDIRNGETPSYINVPPGNYTFRFRGANGLGIWDREGIRLTIKILPPWWKTFWAYSLYALIAIGGVVSFDRVQRRRIKILERERSREKELEQAREIEKAYNELKATQTQLIQSEKMASLGELTAGIAHEIQNPLNFVNNFSDLNSELLDELIEEIKKGNVKEALEIATDIITNEKKIWHHGKRAESIVKNMLQHSRGDAGQKVMTDINAMVEEYVNLAFHGMRARDKSFNSDYKIELDKKVPFISIVPQDIGRVLLNLVNNAFYAVYDKRWKNEDKDYKPIVHVSTKLNKGDLVIRVRDNGLGIADSNREKIFQPFFTTKPAGQGTGLGLSLSYDIVTAHGGKVKVKSPPTGEAGKENEGTEFIINLPIN